MLLSVCPTFANKKYDDDTRPFTLQASADDLTLPCLLVEPEEGASVGILQLVHGMCEHKERYEPLMQFMAARGYACVIHDKSMFACEKEGRELSNDNFKKRKMGRKRENITEN